MAKINYNSETRKQVIKLVLKNEKSANPMAKGLGIGPNMVDRWANDYRKERRIRKVSIEELAAKNRELEKLLKKREKELADEKETVEILKKLQANVVIKVNLFAYGHD